MANDLPVKKVKGEKRMLEDLIFCLVLVITLAVMFAAMYIIVLEPGIEAVVLKFGKYSETLKQPGLHFRQPIGRTVNKVSVREVTHDIPLTTVVEANGNPVNISAVVRYRVVDSARAILDVEDHKQYVGDQASATVKRVISRYPYESPDPAVPCLRKESEDIGEALREELQESVDSAGVRILSVRLNDLTYAPEIAQAMLLRQQAQALIDARKLIVEGAVEMVNDAHARLQGSGFALTPDEQERLISNLMVVLCSGTDVTPTLPLGGGAAGR